MAQLTLTQLGIAKNNDTNYMDFVLNYDTMTAKFCNLQPTKSHRLEARIKNKEKQTSGYWRVWSIGDRGIQWAPKTYNNGKEWDSPILKSNLQKAVRQMNIDEALKTTIELALIDQQALLRRLPIIAIEDVSLIGGTATIVWLMMVRRSNLSMKEIAFVLKYVSALCQTQRTFFNDKRVTARTSCFKSVIIKSKETQRDEVAALYVRAGYGGMQGDIKMLRRAIIAFRVEPVEYTMALVKDVSVPRVIDLDHEVLPSSIDFHPRPWILKYIHHQTNIPESTIKSIIWNAESAPNNRKLWTVEKSKIAKSEDIWPLIKHHLDIARILLNNKRVNKESI